MNSNSKFFLNDVPLSYEKYIKIACDPSKSVVIESCAGSGKTWLLVSRILRLLLSGNEPSQLLIITFTSKAAEEINDRLLQLLKKIALSNEEDVIDLLLERGLTNEEVNSGKLKIAKKLYQKILGCGSYLSIGTFHSWFLKLIRVAPLESGIPFFYKVEEQTNHLKKIAWKSFIFSISSRKDKTLIKALMKLYEILGEKFTTELINKFINMQSEWFIIKQFDDPLMDMIKNCKNDLLIDPRIDLWNDNFFISNLVEISDALNYGTESQKVASKKIKKILNENTNLKKFDNLIDVLLTKDKFIKKNLIKSNTSNKNFLNEDSLKNMKKKFDEIHSVLINTINRSKESKVIILNEALFQVGEAFLNHYSEKKIERQIFDYSDIELNAWKLINFSNFSPYIQSRLDEKYKHILIDEFQDTNNLQWSVIKSWLNAYEYGIDKPRIFIVGDPKQSIYHFRRAEPKVFETAKKKIIKDGGFYLSCSQSRRNAFSIIELLNKVMSGSNLLYKNHTTSSNIKGKVYRLPLVRVKKNDLYSSKEKFNNNLVKNSFFKKSSTAENFDRQEEGFIIGLTSSYIKKKFNIEKQLNWSDFLILVKNRNYLTDWELGLRKAEIPFISNRSGGLLNSLEIKDLLALLKWFVLNSDDLSLVHILKSPIFRISDNDLILIYSQKGKTWWNKLKNLNNDIYQKKNINDCFSLLTKWNDLSIKLPIHDLLDRIIYEGDILKKYSEFSPDITRNKIIGNINAFIELTLNIDSGRYPVLSKFLEYIEMLQISAGNESPDEADFDENLDAVRIMTIHGSKGLESEVVFLIGTNQSPLKSENFGILCDWPVNANSPKHFSVYGKSSERGFYRENFFNNEEKAKLQEEQNLLYVAMTRAKRLLILSGTYSEKIKNGIIKDSWYERCLSAEELQFDSTKKSQKNDENIFSIDLFQPTKTEKSIHSVKIDRSKQLILHGTLLHSLMEFITNQEKWPFQIPNISYIIEKFSCSSSMAEKLQNQVKKIVNTSNLEKFFNPKKYDFAKNEFELFFDKKLIRLDRIIKLGSSLWIIDYKMKYHETDLYKYSEQIRIYIKACSFFFPKLKIYSALITADGCLWLYCNNDFKLKVD